MNSQDTVAVSFLALPDELLLHIIGCLAHPSGISALRALQQTNRHFLQLVSTETGLWDQVWCVVEAKSWSSELSDSDPNPMARVYKWWARNKPLCEHCGAPAPQTFRHFTSFMNFSNSFLCLTCSRASNEKCLFESPTVPVSSSPTIPNRRTPPPPSHISLNKGEALHPNPPSSKTNRQESQQEESSLVTSAQGKKTGRKECLDSYLLRSIEPLPIVHLSKEKRKSKG